jgi:hypothetical protein
MMNTRLILRTGKITFLDNILSLKLTAYRKHRQCLTRKASKRRNDDVMSICGILSLCVMTAKSSASTIPGFVGF